MRINTNTAAMNTYSNLTSANASKSNSLAKLSSGLRINKAGDDAAGLAISEKMKNQISGMTQASRNAQDGISLIQTAEGGLTETHSILNRMRDLTVQAANSTNTTEDKKFIQKEMSTLSSEVTRIADSTKFNKNDLMNAGTALINRDITVGSLNAAGATTGGEMEKLEASYKTVTGVTTSPTGADLANSLKSLSSDKLDAVIQDYNKTAAAKITGSDQLRVAAGATTEAKFTFQIGAGAGEKIDVTIKNMTAKGLGIDNIDVTIANSTDAILGKLDVAIEKVSEQRADLGATQNRLDHTVSNLATTKENLSEANSRITDVDMAEEMMSFTKSNILSQASTAMLAQANQMPQGVLQLLQ